MTKNRNEVATENRRRTPMRDVHEIEAMSCPAFWACEGPMLFAFTNTRLLSVGGIEIKLPADGLQVVVGSTEALGLGLVDGR